MNGLLLKRLPQRLTKSLGLAKAQITRPYHARDHPNPIVDPSRIENKILSKALEYVPKHGFQDACINDAIKDLGYADSIRAVLSTSYNGNSSELQLMIHWLKTQRQKLTSEATVQKLAEIPSEYDRVSFLINERLSYNVPIIDKLLSGIAHLIVPYNLQLSLEELHNLGDDIAFYAGDDSHDFSWYSKRFCFSTAYVSSELFMLQDSSSDFSATKQFVEDKVNNINTLGNAYENMEQWAFFNAVGLVNLVKSQTVRG